MGKIHYLMESLSIEIKYDHPISELPGLISWIKSTGTGGRFSQLRYHFQDQNTAIFGSRNGYLQELDKKLIADEMLEGYRKSNRFDDWNVEFITRFQAREKNLAAYFKLSYG